MSEQNSFGQDLSLVAASNRVKPYISIHKALRRYFSEALVALGSLDTKQPVELDKWLQTATQFLAVAEAHAMHENKWFHEPLLKKDARAVTAFTHDHEMQDIAIETFRKRLRDIDLHVEARERFVYEYYLELSVFVADMFAHMAEEETLLTRTLWRNFDDQEINQFHDGLVASLTPEDNAFYTDLIFRAINVNEICEMLMQVQDSAPEPIFDAVKNMLNNAVSPERWQHLSTLMRIA